MGDGSYFDPIGLTAGVGINPAYGMGKTFSWGAQIHMGTGLYLDTQFAGHSDEYGANYFALIAGANISVDRSDRIFVNAGIGIGGYPSRELTRPVFEIGVGYKLFRYRE